MCWWAQALLDVYTILREVGKVNNVRIALVGDLANGRTARSLAYLLSMYSGVKMYFVAPDVVRMGDDIKDFLDSKVGLMIGRELLVHWVFPVCWQAGQQAAAYRPWPQAMSHVSFLLQAKFSN